MGGLIVLSRLPLQGVLGATSPFLLSWPATMLAAFLSGFWPATAVSLLGLRVGQWALAAGGARLRSLRRAEADAARLTDMQRRLAAVARLNAMGEIAP